MMADGIAMSPGRNEIGESDLRAEFKVHFLEYPAEDDSVDGEAVAVCLIVLRRLSGLLLAVPQDFFSADMLAAGLVASAEELLGQSTLVTLPAGQVQNLEDVAPPVPVAGATVQVVLIDFNMEVAQWLRPFADGVHPMPVVHTFDNDNPLMLPLMEPLIEAAWGWVQDPASGERAGFYSAQEEEIDQVPETPPVVPRQARARAQPGTGEGAPRKPRQTVATLASQLESLASSMPSLVRQIESLNARTATMESHLAAGPSRSSALQQPLGSLATPGLPAASMSTLLKEMPPPRSTGKNLPRANANVGLAQPQALELEMEKGLTEDPPVHLTQAILEQSKALSTLVSQIAGDPVGDLASSSTSFSSRGAAGRQKLQQELAMHRGTFYQAVLASMARRMQPARPADATPAELLGRGISATAYVERFGGFGRCRDMGQIMWMVAMIMDHIQAENMGAIQDAVALLMVCLEQTALDNGRMDIGLLLALQEDPPAALFTNRTLAGYSRGKAFAPLADQRWVANALTYLKELDAITAKRNDATHRPNAQPDRDTQGDPKKAPKKKPQPKWKQSKDKDEED